MSEEYTDACMKERNRYMVDNRLTQRRFPYASISINSNRFTSNSPISVSLSSGMTGSDMKQSVITGSSCGLTPSASTAVS